LFFFGGADLWEIVSWGGCEDDRLGGWDARFSNVRAGSSPQKSLNRSEIKVDSGGRSLLGQRRCHEAESEQGRGNYLAQQLFEGKKVQRRNIRPLCKAQ